MRLWIATPRQSSQPNSFMVKPSHFTVPENLVSDFFINSTNNQTTVKNMQHILWNLTQSLEYKS